MILIILLSDYKMRSRLGIIGTRNPPVDRELLKSNIIFSPSANNTDNPLYTTDNDFGNIFKLLKNDTYLATFKLEPVVSELKEISKDFKFELFDYFQITYNEVVLVKADNKNNIGTYVNIEIGKYHRDLKAKITREKQDQLDRLTIGAIFVLVICCLRFI